MIMSHCVQPKAVISARLVGRNSAGCEPAECSLTLENKGAAVCTPAIRPECSAYVDRNVALGIIALNQQGDAVSGPRQLPLDVRHRRDLRPVDAEHHIARLQSRGQGRAGDILDYQAAARMQLALLIRIERPQRKPQLAAAVLALGARRL